MSTGRDGIEPAASGDGTVYLLHFEKPYKRARHYTGKSESSAFLKPGLTSDGGEFAELDGPVSGFWGCQSACSWSVGVFPSFQALPDRQGGDDQACRRIGPPPPEPGVQADAEQGGRRGQCAERAFGGVGDQRLAAQRTAGAALGQGQQRHHDQRGRGHGEPEDGLLRSGMPGQVADALDGEVGREREERDADQPHRAGFPVPALALAVQLPDDDGRGGELDHRVQTEPDQGDGRGDHASGDRDGGLRGHPGHARVLKPEPALTHPVGALGSRCRRHARPPHCRERPHRSRFRAAHSIWVSPRLQESRRTFAITAHSTGLLSPRRIFASDISPWLHWYLSCGKAKTTISDARTNCRQVQQWTSDLPARLEEHRKGRGARLMEVIKDAGIGFRVARTWPGTRGLERAIKDRHEAPRLCPECTPQPRPVATGRSASASPAQKQTQPSKQRRQTPSWTQVAEREFGERQSPDQAPHHGHASAGLGAGGIEPVFFPDPETGFIPELIEQPAPIAASRDLLKVVEQLESDWLAQSTQSETDAELEIG